MVNSGGNSTMLGQWRIALRQAEESARAGRFDEALALVSRSDVADHRQAVRLRGRLAMELIGRASRRAAADDLDGAIDDLNLAERFGVAPDVLAAARLKLAEQVDVEIRGLLDAGEPSRVIERIDQLAKQHIGGPALRRTREAAEVWQLALDESRRGEFGRAREALERAERLAGESAANALATVRRDLGARQEAAQPRIERFYKALTNIQNWGEILAAAESVLEILPEHPASRQARARAWQQIGAINPSAALPCRAGRLADPLPGLMADQALDAGANHPSKKRVPPIVFLDESDQRQAAPLPLAGQGRPLPRRNEPNPMDRPPNPGPSGRCLLWADVIGGYLICLNREIVLGREGIDTQADVPVLGDLSRRHASIVRHGDGYVIQAHQPTFLNGRPVVGSAPLRDKDVLRLGSTVELEFRQPSPVSATARLEIVSRHRLPLAVEGVILMAETCIIGPSPQAHVPAPGLGSPVVLYRQGDALWCRAPGAFDVDGKPCLSRAPLRLNSNVLGDGFSFSLEPLLDRPSTA